MEEVKIMTIVISVIMSMFFVTLWVISLTDAYINSPDEFTIRFEIENKTQEVIKGLNGSITINNYYGNLTKEITLCKDTYTNYYLQENGEFFEKDTFQEVYECDLNRK